MERKKYFLSVALMGILAVAGCGGESDSAQGHENSSAPASKDTPSFTLFWSEYPSWSAYGVADKLGIINGKQGVLGPIEQKHGVDIVLKQADYEPCITAYAGGQADAVCVTNMDILSPSLGRQSVAVAPTSTSYGADAIIVTDSIKSIQDLKGKKVFGLEKSVSQYLVSRTLSQAGMQESDVQFSQMDPGAAAQAMQGGQSGFDAIVVWEPYLSQTLAKRKDVHVLVDSTKIEGEIKDMVVVGADVLKKPGSDQFVHAILEAYYEVNKWLADPKTTDTTHVALGEKFSNLNAVQMRDVLTRCRFFGTPDKGAEAFDDPNFPDIMKRVVEFSKSHGIVDHDPTISYDPKTAGKANLIFDTSFMTK